MSIFTTLLVGGLAVVGGASDGAARVEGDYIEARTADVYTGPCFSNAEVFLTGHQAVVAWRVRTGSWKGEDLSGLVVGAAVRGTTTFSFDDEEFAQAVILVDERATAEQREALADLARELGGRRLAKASQVKVAKMNLFIEEPMAESAEHAGAHHGPMAPRGTFWAAGLAEINTRPLESTDHVCGNEVIAYQPLSRGVTATPAYTLVNAYKGNGLSGTWNDQNCRGSFVGTFSY